MATKFPFSTPDAIVDVELEVGTHVLELTVEDSAGNFSEPAQVTITVLGLPDILDLQPAAGLPGAQIQIVGRHFTDVTAVRFFDGVPAESHSVLDAEHISAVVPEGALTGPVTVTTVNGEAVSPMNFVVEEVEMAMVPPSQTLDQGASQVFTATVSGSGNQAVTWELPDGVGSVSPTGPNTARYTAPHTAGNYRVVARSVADPSKTAEAAVSVRAVSISIAPSTVDLAPGQRTDFTVAVTGTVINGYAVAVSGGEWSKDNGTLTYTAPPEPGRYTITVTADGAPTTTAQATASVQSVTQVDAIVPNTVASGAQQFRVRVDGNGLAQVREMSFPSSANMISAEILGGTDTSMEVALDVSPQSPEGRYSFDLHLESGETINSGDVVLAVKAAAPGLIEAITPSTASAGSNLERVVIRGSGLSEATLVGFSDGGILTQVLESNDTGVVISMGIKPVVGPGSLSFWVDTPRGRIESGRVSFTVTALGGEVVDAIAAIEAIEPTGAAPGTSDLAARIFGSGLAATTRVEFDNRGIGVELLEVSNSLILLTLTVSRDATPGASSFSLVSRSGEPFAKSGNFRVFFTVSQLVRRPLGEVTGIGATFEGRLREAGVNSAEELAALEPARAARILGVSEAQATTLIEEARRQPL